MRFLANLKNYFSAQEPPPFIEPPATKMEGLEVDFRPVPASRVGRKLGRLLSLYRTRNPNQEVYDEILRYRKDLEAFGHTGLTSEEEVLALIEQLNGE
jgi:hypothetical protein